MPWVGALPPRHSVCLTISDFVAVAPSAMEEVRPPKKKRHNPWHRCSDEDDDSECLRHLDEARRQEIALWNQDRWRFAREHGYLGGADAFIADLDVDDVAKDDTTSPEGFLPLWQACYKCLREATSEQEASTRTCTCGEEVMEQSEVLGVHEEVLEQSEILDGGEDTSDLLVGLDKARRKELNRVRQQRRRAKVQESSKVSEDFDNELSAGEREACMKKLRRALGPEGLDECVCAACDRLVLRQDAKRMEDSDSDYLKKMKKSLSVDKNIIPPKLLHMYQSPVHLTILDDVMVSPRGIHSYTGEHASLRAWLSVCNECDRSIQRGMLPKFAIANGFFVGSLQQHLRSLTIPERFMTQLANVIAITRVMRGGRHRCIRSHCIAFDCTPGPLASLLPRMLEEVDSYRVVLVGEVTKAQTSQMLKMHKIRNHKVRAVLSFYQANNHLYAGVGENEIALNREYTDDNIDEALMEHIADPGGVLERGMDQEQESVRGESDAWRVTSEDSECNVIERRIGLADDGTPATVREYPAASKGLDEDRLFEVHRSSQLSNDVSGNLLARMFPHLFPFGRGHPGEHRQIHVSAHECVKYYTRLSGRQFAEDELFSLVAFDRISLRNMYVQNYYRCQRFPRLLEGYENLTGEQLGKALQENERRRQGCLPWKPTPDSVAQRFLKTVEIGSRVVWGSNAERSQYRHQAFAYQTRFGQPALFVTLTPNTDNALVLAHYAGISSVETLFDILDSRTPSKAELREASRGNDCASARLFMRQIDAFIRFALGIDPATRKRLSFRGLFGDVKAFFGMVETQGRGTLHIHFLIWLNNCPPNSASVERLLKSSKGDRFREKVTAFAQSIVRNDLPISLDKCGCSNCGASFSDLTGLPIPDHSRKAPKTGIKSRKDWARCIAAEPLLIECSRCRTRFSSQHLIRNVLLKLRPRHWPPWDAPMSLREVEERARVEGVCRPTMQHAVNAITYRESLHASYCSELSTHEGEEISAELLQEANYRQMPLCKSDDDPFRNDEMTRLLEISPPSPDDTRMSRVSLDYMVSVLAVLLNQHLWCHTTSCFKQSRVTSNDTYCRYRFPQPRVTSTSFGSSGVELKRSLGHEFMNGFNYEIMATFKCNHDIQVLLGGCGVTDRIHYCCKYVTKQQKQLDSQVAVAVAALKRRQVRENEASAATGGAAQDRLDRSRKRVAGMIYNLTNKQEIAGPLAALYLYRGSCCYSSAKCTRLPLGDTIRQLMKVEDYSCNLVNDGDNLETSKFRAVSFLDDYIFRPQELASLNLYEFTMKYFRKKTESGTRSKSLSFIGSHPLHATYRLCKRHEETVPVIGGFRMPNKNGDASLEQRCKYAVMALVLFKPFRKLADLIGASSDGSDEQTWLTSFEQWRPKRSKFVHEIMDNMDDYYSGLEKAKASREKTAAAAPDSTEGADSDSSTRNRDDDLFVANDLDDLDAAGGVVEDDEGDQNLIQLWSTERDGNFVLDSSLLDPASCPTSVAPDNKVAHIVDIFAKHGILSNVASKTAREACSEWPIAQLPSVALMKKWVKAAETDNTLLASASTEPVPHSTTVVELLEDCLQDLSTAWQRSPTLACSVNIPKSFASISDTSRAYTLNENQHYAFKAIGKALLSRWRQAEESYDVDETLYPVLSDGQLLMFLGGEGGTGKSRIVDAVQTFCESWGRPNCLVKAALTGKAATLIGGRTLAGFLLQIKKKRVSEEIAALDLIIIDEVSMMKKFQLSQLDIRLRIAKRVRDVPFGGVHIVLVGDFLQLPPVGGYPLYVDPTKVGKPNAGELAGYELWRNFKTVVVLKESVRFHNDPEWGSGCQQARLGIWTPEFVQLINSRVLSEEVLSEAVTDESFGTFVTPDNSTRVSINNLFISSSAKLLPEREYPVRVIANFKGKLTGLRRSEVRTIMQLPDTKFGRMAPYLDLIVGMPIQVTQNIRAAKHVANGTLGRLLAIVYHPDTTFRLVHDTIADITVKVPSHPPPAVIVNIERGPCAKPLLGVDDSNVFPLFFDSEAYSACNITLAGTINGVPRSLSVRIQQFPLVCSVSSTVYKVQGETLNGMVVTEWRSSNAVANKKEQPYLLVSRVTCRKAFATLTPLTGEVIAWAHPPKGAIDEEARLERLSCETIARLRNS